MESTELMTASNAELLENVLVNGDLAKLTAPQRLDYYRQVCQSMGLNPLSKPFDYINLNGKLTLYAKKDATDQLRKINGISIDDVQQSFDGDMIIVTVKGSDRSGRRDVDFGVVNKNEMRGNVGNAMMKAVTKAKRRLTLSLCGLGWLDETEIESIPDAKPVIVDDDGEIIDVQKPQTKPIEAPKPQKPQWSDEEFLKQWTKPGWVQGMSRTNAECMVDDKGNPYGEKDTKTLWNMQRVIMKKIADATTPADAKDLYNLKLAAICEILQNRKLELTLPEETDPFVGQE